MLIPETYVRDLPVRLGLYRRIGALATDGESEAMAAELVDRFGALPEEVDNLLQVMALKRGCRQAGVERVEAGPKGMVLQFRGNAFANPGGLVGWLGHAEGRDPAAAGPQAGDQRGRWRSADRIKTAREVLRSLNRIATQAKAA